VQLALHRPVLQAARGRRPAACAACSASAGPPVDLARARTGPRLSRWRRLRRPQFGRRSSCRTRGCARARACCARRCAPCAAAWACGAWTRRWWPARRCAPRSRCGRACRAARSARAVGPWLQARVPSCMSCSAWSRQPATRAAMRRRASAWSAGRHAEGHGCSACACTCTCRARPGTGRPAPCFRLRCGDWGAPAHWWSARATRAWQTGRHAWEGS